MNEYLQLSQENRIIVGQRTDRMLSGIESRRKSYDWRLGARVSTKTTWYNPVGDW